MRNQANAPKHAREVFEYLKRCAKQMRTVSYREIATVVGSHPIAMRFSLGYIRDNICREHGLPWLNAIAVNWDTWYPGGGFLPKDVDMPGEDERLMWRGMVLQVFAHDWTSVEFDDSS